MIQSHLLSLSHPERHPTVVFQPVYHLSRVFGLTPDQKKFLFKMVQSPLPTRERLARIRKAASSACLYCDGNDPTAHLLTCTLSQEVSIPLINCLHSYFDIISPEDIVLLNIPAQESLQLSVAWIVSSCLGLIWIDRSAGRRTRLDACRAQLIANVSIMKHKKWKQDSFHNTVVLLGDMINWHFSL